MTPRMSSASPTVVSGRSATPAAAAAAWAIAQGDRSKRGSAAGRRGELLPLGVVEVGAATPLEELHDRRHDGADHRDLHELAEESALLLLDIGVVTHDVGLLASGWPSGLR